MIVRITRVKVGNRQAPQQQTETPPRKRWGFCVYAPENAQAATRRHPPRHLHQSQNASLTLTAFRPDTTRILRWSDIALSCTYNAKTLACARHRHRTVPIRPAGRNRCTFRHYLFNCNRNTGSALSSALRSAWLVACRRGEHDRNFHWGQVVLQALGRPNLI